MTTTPIHGSAPETVARARVASLTARGVLATSRRWDSWIDDSGGEPWLVVRPDELLLEVVFAPGHDIRSSRRILLRLLADRWSIVVRVHPGDVPSAQAIVGDLPLRVESWDHL